jgi:SAM-dependent methyltransferase
MAALLSDVTDTPYADVCATLRAEHADPGSVVRHDLQARGIALYEWSDAMDRFYRESDAFMYELAIWNHNRIKCRMRRRIVRHLKAMMRDGLTQPRVLSVGDGLGVDSLAASRIGCATTYFEFEGPTAQFARGLFRNEGADITVRTDPDALQAGTFDALICLDVLEHVPRPEDLLRTLTGYLKPGGVLYVSAPFHLLHPAYGTHLECNRRYAGRFTLYRRAGLVPIDASYFWLPLIWQKAATRAEADTSTLGWWRLLAARATGVGYAAARFGLVWTDLLHRIRCANDLPGSALETLEG